MTSLTATPSPGLINYPEQYSVKISDANPHIDNTTTNLPQFGYVGTAGSGSSINGQGAGVALDTSGGCPCKVQLLPAGDTNTTINWSWTT